MSKTPPTNPSAIQALCNQIWLIIILCGLSIKQKALRDFGVQDGFQVWAMWDALYSLIDQGIPQGIFDQTWYFACRDHLEAIEKHLDEGTDPTQCRFDVITANIVARSGAGAAGQPLPALAPPK